MMKNHFTNALKGILIGLILSILFSFLNSPSTYTPLSPSSAVGQWMQAHEVHGSLVMLYCTLIWAGIGLLFSLGNVLFNKDLSLLPTFSNLGRLVPNANQFLSLCHF